MQNMNPWYEEDLFARICPHYVEMHLQMMDTVKDNLKKRIPSKIKVLEIGCGSGFTTAHIIATLPQAMLSVVDIDENALNFTKKRFQHLESDTHFYKNDAVSFLRTIEDGHYDFIISAFTIHNFEKKYRYNFLEEAYRSLKSKGILINGDKYAAGLPEHHNSLAWQLKKIIDICEKEPDPSLMLDWLIHYLDDESAEYKMDASEEKEIFQSIGFRKAKFVYREKLEAIMFAQR